MKLQGKIALVTGSGTGIGAAIALRLAQEGAQVVINYRKSAGPAEQVAQQCQTAGGPDAAITVQGDISVVADCYKIVQAAIEKYGRLDILINNAGIEFKDEALSDVSEAHWDAVINTNLKGAFFCTQAAVKQMLAAGKGGKIINISSIHEDEPMPRNTPYCASKGGLQMLARNLGVELAPQGITVVNIAPGAIATPINSDTLQDPAKIEELKAAIPLHRLGTPEDVAALAAWLASDEAAYVNATTFTVDGGFMMNASSL